MAHTFGSLTKPKYLEAAKLLDTVESNSNDQLIDLKTAAISNIKRDILSNHEIDIHELQSAFKILLRSYAGIYKKTENSHYYPGINLMYIAKLNATIFPDDSNASDLQQIYHDCMPSIKHDKSEKNLELRYYAWMSELEFMLLLDHKDVQSEMYLLLDEIHPPYALVERTLRQMEFFTDIAKRFIDVEINSVMMGFKNIIEILEGYLESL